MSKSISMQSSENKKERIIRTEENKIDKTATMTCGHAKALEELGDGATVRLSWGRCRASWYLIVQGVDADQNVHCSYILREKSELSRDEIRGNTMKMRGKLE